MQDNFKSAIESEFASNDALRDEFVELTEGIMLKAEDNASAKMMVAAEISSYAISSAKDILGWSLGDEDLEEAGDVLCCSIGHFEVALAKSLLEALKAADWSDLTSMLMDECDIRRSESNDRR